MKKHFLSLAVLVALACVPSMHGAAQSPVSQVPSLKTLALRSYVKNLLKTAPAASLESEDAFIKAGLVPNHMTIADIKPELGREYSLRLLGYFDPDDPDWIAHSFIAYMENPAAGFSIQDLLDHGLRPEIKEGLLELDLTGRRINDLTGIQNIPNAKDLQILKLDGNRISTIPSGAFSALGSLQKLFIQNNPIHDVAPGAFAGLSNLKEAYYNGIIMPENRDSVTNTREVTRLRKLLEAQFELVAPNALVRG